MRVRLKLHSVFYQLGWLASSFVPGLGAAGDTRDLAQSAINLDAVGFGLNAIGIVPGLGVGSDVLDASRNVGKWVKTFPSKVGDLVKVVGKYLLPKLPDSVSVRLVDAATGGSATALKKEGIPLNDAIKYLADGYDPGVIKRLRSQRVRSGTIRTAVDKGYDLHRASSLRKGDIPAHDVDWYVHNGVSLHLVEILNKKYSSKRTRSIIESARNAKKKTKTKRILTSVGLRFDNWCGINSKNSTGGAIC